jgi:hypothetical protein
MITWSTNYKADRVSFRIIFAPDVLARLCGQRQSTECRWVSWGKPRRALSESSFIGKLSYKGFPAPAAFFGGQRGLISPVVAD